MSELNYFFKLWCRYFLVDCATSGEDADFDKRLSRLSFLRRPSDDLLMRPRDFYDIDDPELVDLFRGEHRFPDLGLYIYADIKLSH